MQQGTLGDCWFLAAIMSAQQTDPGQLAENIAARGSPPGADGWEVELFIDGQWESITVSPEVVTNDGAMQGRGGKRGGGGTGCMAGVYRVTWTATELIVSPYLAHYS